MKITFPVALIFFASLSFAQSGNLELHYDFKTAKYETVIPDISGNGYSGTLKNNAYVDNIGQYALLNLGLSNGYLDMGEKAGQLINSMEDFSVSTYVLVDESSNLEANGNFIWTFSNSDDIASDRNGCIFYSAKNQEYSITKTDYREDVSFGMDSPLTKQQWKHVVYTQKGKTGTIYLDGKVQSTNNINITPAELGQTQYNFLGRSPYNGDAYLKGSIADFRVYSKALSAKQVIKLSNDLKALNATVEKYLSKPKKFVSSGNPIIRHKYTADPAALVHDGVFYIYSGQDIGDGSYYNMPNWCVFSSEDMETWYEHPVPLKANTFNWTKDNSSWASQVIERDGKFYWYVSAEHASGSGKAIGVAVSDSPTGPFEDARGSAIITNDMTTRWTGISWDDIDPTVWIDDDGQAYLFWGNTQCYYAKLKDNMIELDGDIIAVDLPNFTEAPWIHKNGDWYYLSYAYQWPEKTAYARSKSIEGPWEFGGILNELAGNSNTNHQAIVKYKGDWYFVYHNGGIGGSYLRSVCIDYLYHNPDGTIKRIQMTSEGVEKIMP
ncbi:family 43 glycosylhydrolase [Marinoscillum sp. MHG1-6]|uniref:family 43 glycosylhydrolase n=1 Tax=Marinoscillum sp. MHG1-6 TaxID=2959627 RepID=UPI002157BA30|nr:family 43 glycosylhydrolase [Marinoscillum sp. MHG1-6]